MPRDEEIFFAKRNASTTTSQQQQQQQQQQHSFRCHAWERRWQRFRHGDGVERVVVVLDGERIIVDWVVVLLLLLWRTASREEAQSCRRLLRVGSLWR
mmetsp:Transcript_15184/g.31548  ORF Transcript_15184/g.31548 Transcript_15184/m.31548 type:complete len:98 (+) Transcript_15184:150-443(+)